jgi:hypothetical protein
MFTKIMKWISIAMLLLGILLMRTYSSDYRLFVIAFVIWAGATAVLVEAARSGKYLWMAAFFGVAAFFNPVWPIMLSPKMFLTLDLISLVLFMFSLTAVKTSPRLSIASITDTSAQAESL